MTSEGQVKVISGSDQGQTKQINIGKVNDKVRVRSRLYPGQLKVFNRLI